ncbi:MAG: preprotein translocase subunit SecG [Thermoanaerobaculales bacterium]|nr:preprotein translocase subunit SecG [Thermoanaerobaculales bacterium]
MGTLLVIIYVLVCIFLVMVVLLQQSKGADLAGAFGGGGSQASFGPRSSTNIMHRMTTISFVLFIVLSMVLAIFSGKARTSVMEEVEGPGPAAAVEVQTGGTDGSSMESSAEADALPAGDESFLEIEDSETPPTTPDTTEE